MSIQEQEPVRLCPVTKQREGWMQMVCIDPAVAACGGSCPLKLPGTIVNVAVLAGGMEQGAGGWLSIFALGR